MARSIRVNMVSESDISVQGHGVHTAYDELASALEARPDVTVIRGDFGNQTDCDVVHLHTIGFRTMNKLFQKGPKKVITAHVVPASFIGSIILARYWAFIARWYMRWYYNKADKVLAVSATVAETLQSELHVPKAKIAMAYNTVNMDSYAPAPTSRRYARKKLGLATSAFVVLGNGQVQPRKRLDIFITMAKALPEVQFIWVGGIPFRQLGADYKSMQRLIATVPPNLTITGIIPHGDVLAYLHAADVFCLPAEQENHPMCVLEAAGAQLPIVLRDLPEYNDTFGHDGLRCNDQTFLAAIEQLQSDPKFYKEWQAKATAIAKRFDSSAAAESTVNLYRSLL